MWVGVNSQELFEICLFNPDKSLVYDSRGTTISMKRQFIDSYRCCYVLFSFLLHLSSSSISSSTLLSLTSLFVFVFVFSFLHLLLLLLFFFFFFFVFLYFFILFYPSLHSLSFPLFKNLKGPRFPFSESPISLKNRCKSSSLLTSTSL